MAAEYVDRDALREELYEADAISMRGAAIISRFPAADVVPVRHGKWETAFLAHEYLGCRPYAHYCSVCHQIIAFRTFYCPNCGARMDGDGDGV